MANDREIQLLIKAKDEAQGVLSGHLKKLDELTQAHLGLSLKAVAAYAAVGTAIVGATVELYKFADRMAEMGDAMDEMSARTNMSVEDLSKWSYVLAKDGASIQEFEGATRKLARAMYDASTGGKETAAAFAALGVDIVGSDGKLISVSDAMLKVSDGLKNTGNDAERTALMMALLGRGSGDLAVVMNKGSDAIRAQMGELERLGGGMTGEYAAAAANFEDAQARMVAAIDGVKMKAAEPLFNPFAATVDNASLAVRNLSGALEWYSKILDKLPKGMDVGILNAMGLGFMAGPSGGSGAASAPREQMAGSLNYGSYATPAQMQQQMWEADLERKLQAARDSAVTGGGYFSPTSGPAADTFELGNLLDPMEDFDAILKEAGTHSLVLKDNMAEVGSTGQQSAMMIGSAMASALEQAIFEARDLDDILGGLARSFVSMGLMAALTPGAGFLGLEQGARIPGAAQGMSVRGGIPGMDSVLISAQHGEEVLDRTLAADLRSYLAQVRFSPGAANLKGAASTGGNYAVAISTVYPTRPADSRRIGRDIVRSIKEAERSTL